MTFEQKQKIKKASALGGHYKFQMWFDEVRQHPCTENMTAEQIAAMIDYGYMRECRGWNDALETRESFYECGIG